MHTKIISLLKGAISVFNDRWELIVVDFSPQSSLLCLVNREDYVTVTGADSFELRHTKPKLLVTWLSLVLLSGFKVRKQKISQPRTCSFSQAFQCYPASHYLGVYFSLLTQITTYLLNSFTLSMAKRSCRFLYAPSYSVLFRITLNKSVKEIRMEIHRRLAPFKLITSS